MIFLGILVFGMGIGWLAQLILGRDGRRIDWVMALVAGLAGSLVGGLVASLIAGDGIKLRASGFIARSAERSPSPPSGNTSPTSG
ncbi:MAG TPA: hypothetical protein VLL25_01515 [Acidimicrobiales bacterium]|nr:hypothetical protein [Acidimicrobiales bacterium]